MQPKIAIVVPCYNEFTRLPKTEFKKFLGNFPNAHICFVNDASDDDTLNLLNGFSIDFPNQVSVLSNTGNLGKAASVQKGVLYCSKNQIAPVLGYLDADLATSLEECYSYLDFLTAKKHFVFASRILKIGSVVERKFSRFLFGRIIATFISNILEIKVYDTQCGCKVFKTELTQIMFEKPFISKWLFDVELFSRMLGHFGKEAALEKMEEIPVKRWINRGESKVRLSYFFRLWYDLYLIRKAHRDNVRL
ncbi:glycosyltransferase [Costertonia aggregata]|uniref:Glycosyltransferase n=1 Tax=Costertonia aggregata TaxID=343403 RepID=A0A7H9AQ96_9FLAO|nr:glycosyltransferase [Costertonia aggregata]QLG45602.1 glycosyltransferase [Costertonia aggregata]